ncbi:putative Multiple myeloma tumor-associated protein 2 [Cladophialophora carrionii]|uniref:Putative Multiple myeloma tumor-associated protein 2 n=1 Tax=Cladophialophora carrionii TaxID=86049 RepID=A0A1C1CPU7_9EURO|nr:putative Multiple myeloma tumor-associated protein 2 [Cladophialophora carrionii]
MDLLATVRKEGSRGGRGDFKWSDVQTSSHRENYLGHSLMAPVGRWQKGRDLNWYAKADSSSNADEDPAARAARERKEEIRRVKEAEEDALARALGLPVAPRHNPNMEELGTQREVGNVLKAAAGDEDAAMSRGVGYGRPAGGPPQIKTRSFSTRSGNTNAAMVIEDTEAEVEAGIDAERGTKEDTEMTTTAIVSAVTMVGLRDDRDPCGRDQDPFRPTASGTTLVVSNLGATPRPIAVTKRTGMIEKDGVKGRGVAR